MTAPEHVFDLHRCIGVGGFGEVYLATMSDPDGGQNDVAVKILHPGIDPTAQAIQRLQDEARLLGLLQHPSIIRVVDLLQYKGRLALVTEYVDGEDLSSCFLAIPPPSPRAMLEVVGRVAAALDAAWRTPSPDGSGELQLIHRDLKPSNIRISRCGDVKLLDFGLAHADHADRQAHTEAHTLLGSFLYMAPERYLQQPATSASDAFALGCCLYEGLAGEKLFEGRKPVDLYGLLLDGARWDNEMDDRIAAVPSTVPKEARRICRALLAREPHDRMTVTELADCWEDVVESMTGPTLERWATSREWEEPIAVPASLEGSVVASRVLPMEPPPGDDEELDDDDPTVLVRPDDIRGMLGDLQGDAVDPPGARPPGARPPGARPPGARPPSPAGPEALSPQDLSAAIDDEDTDIADEPTVARKRPGRGELTEPMPKPRPQEEGRRVNWLGAGLLATTTVLLTAAIVGLSVVVLVTWLTRSAAEAPETVVEQPQPPPPVESESHVQVDGVSRAWLQRGRRRIDVGDVPAGMWTLWVDFGEGERRVGTLRIPKGERIVVACEMEHERCRLPGDEPETPSEDGEEPSTSDTPAPL